MLGKFKIALAGFCVCLGVINFAYGHDGDDDRREYDSRMTRDFIETKREQVAQEQGFQLYPSPYDDETPYRPYRIDDTEGE